jgi:ribosomal protein S18 acetylase RimI-like enzyme
MAHLPSHLHLRPAQPEDAPALARHCLPEHDPTYVAESLRRVAHLAQHDHAHALIAQIDADTVGYGQVTRWPRSAEIGNLVVAADWRNLGIGSALIEALAAYAARWPLAEVEIGVALSNPRALALYRRLGFQDCRSLQINLGSGLEPVVYLSRPLSQATGLL